jgi:hypothetical protein
MKTVKTQLLILISITGCLMIGSCKKFLDTPLPTDRLPAVEAYQNDSSAGTVLTGIISTAASLPVYGSVNSFDGLGFATSLYADDLTRIQTGLIAQGTILTGLYYSNTLGPQSPLHWSLLYRQIYSCNLAIENLAQNRHKLAKYDQWMGEALFMRAFSFFDLVNLYGDVPLALVSDYSVNNNLGRSPRAQVYAQIIQDLKQAESMLPRIYLSGTASPTNNRTRPNRTAATALLSRVLLYVGDYSGAEQHATSVIDQSADYELTALNSVFLANSKETIWALAPEASTAVRDFFLYNNGAPNTSPTLSALSNFVPAAMSTGLVTSFQPGDLRMDNWTQQRSTTTAPANGRFYFPNKYKSRTNGAEFNIILRLAEQYLIRAEARVRNNNIPGAVADLNLIRARARNNAIAGALPDYSSTLTLQDCLDAVLQERRVELFTEQSHRFYDIKRLGLIDGIMNVYAPLKGASWASFKQYWPIPASDVQFNPNLSQTPGYN